MKKVSVIVPVYNTDKYLRDCIDSLVWQTMDEIEIILINDGSTDNSLSILKEYEEHFPDKILVIDKENGGQASARNIGIKRASGEYIGFVDSDDYVEEEMFEHLYNVAVDSNADFVECDYKYLKVDAEGKSKVISKYGRIRPYSDKKDMFIDPLVSPWNKLYRANILKENGLAFPEGYIYEDTSFFIKAIPYIENTAYVNQEYVYHFMRENSTMTSNREIRIGNIFPVLQDIIDEYKERGFYELYRQELEYFIIKILLCSSLNRIAHVKSKTVKSQYINSTLKFIGNEFPEYRSNDLIRRSKAGLYMSLVNKVTIRPIVFILGLI